MARKVEKEHILIHTLLFPPDQVSTAYLYGDIVKNLQDYGYKITVLTSFPHYNPPKELEGFKKRMWGLFYESEFYNAKVINIPQSKPNSSIKRLWQFLKFHIISLFIGINLPNFDLILTPSPPLTIGFVTIILAKLKGAKAIYNVQEIYPDIAIEQGTIGNPIVIKILKWMEKFIYKHCDKIITIDKTFNKVLKKRVFTDEKLLTIPNFIDTNLYVPLKKNNYFSSKYNLNEYFVVGYVGNIGESQDWDIIVNAASLLEDQEIIFLIVGDGTKKEWLKKQINCNNLSNVLVLDYQSREKISYVNASADVHTITMTKTSDISGFPSKIFAIMASGRSLIAATDKSSALGRIIFQSNCGRVVDVGDTNDYIKAIKKAKKNQKRLIQEGKNGRKFVESNYKKDIITNKYRKVILCVLAQ